MRAPALLTLGATLWWILACAGGDVVDDAVVPPAENPEEPPTDAGPLAEGQLHVAYPTVTLKAEVGQFVLAPSADALQKLLDEGTGAVIFYGGTVVSVGAKASTIRSEAGTESLVPNSVIIPIRRGIKAKPGDVLLGHWESGSGMKRAVVVEGGTPEAPKVRYLDFELESTMDTVDTFEADRFQKVRRPFDVGTTVACGEGDKREHGVLINKADDQILVSGFASKLEAFELKDCVSLVPNRTFSAGDKVWIPKVNTYVQGKVEKVDPTLGRVWVEHEWAGSQAVDAIAVLDVTPDFVQVEPTETDDDKADKEPGGGQRDDKAREDRGRDVPPRDVPQRDVPNRDDDDDKGDKVGKGKGKTKGGKAKN